MKIGFYGVLRVGIFFVFYFKDYGFEIIGFYNRIYEKVIKVFYMIVI